MKRDSQGKDVANVSVDVAFPMENFLVCLSSTHIQDFYGSQVVCQEISKKYFSIFLLFQSMNL